ncbi:9329_t:CDS:2, partial [Funneliformis geosporum]
GLVVINEIQKPSVYIIQNKEDSKIEIYGYGLELYKKALNLAIMNDSHKMFEELLQKFIKQQASCIFYTK